MSKIKQTTLIEWSDDDVRLWQCAHGGRVPQLQFYDVFAANANAASLSRVLNAKSLAMDTHRVVVVVPRKQALFRYLTLPSIDDDEIKSMVDLQVPQLIPYALDQVMMDYTVVEKKSSGYAKVVVVCVTRDLIDDYLERLAKLSVTPQVITLDVFGLPAYLNMAKMNRDVMKGVSLVIHGEGERIELAFCFNGRVVFARHLRNGVAGLDEKNVQDVLAQIDMTYESFRKEEIGGALSSIISIGRGGVFQQLTKHVATQYNVSVYHIDPLNPLKTSGGFRWPVSVEQQAAWPTLGVGLAQADTEQMINFLPQEVHQEKVKAKSIKVLVKTLVMVVVVGLLAAGGLYAKTYKQQQVLGQLDQRMADVKKRVHALENIKERVDLTKMYFQERVIISEVAQALLNGFPENTTLTLLDVSNSKIVIQGFSTQEKDVQLIQQRMTSARVFHQVSLDFVNKRQAKDRAMAYFKITAQWRGR